MISMSKVQDIRRMRMEGESIADIARMAGVSEPTVRKYLRPQDLSPKMPTRKPVPTLMDRYASIVDGWLESDQGSWHKQRHTAKRIWERLRDEHDADVSYSTVQRYVKAWRSSRKVPGGQFLDQVGLPAEMQVDFGQADFLVKDVKVRMHYLVCVFPFSNVGLAQVFPGENAECVCEGMASVFEYIGGVPRRIVFDNATGIGRKASGVIRTSELFRAFAAHYGFGYTFCNPDAGHEKSSVENKVGFIRRNLFVPIPRFDNVALYNKKLLSKCMGLSGKGHYIKGRCERELFVEDLFALDPMPEAPFKAVSWQRMRADKYGNITLDGRHRYSSAPEYGGLELIVGKRALEIEIYDGAGTHIVTHRRAYGDRPTESVEPASQLATLCRKPGGWPNSRVRVSLPDDLRAWADGLEDDPRRSFLRTLRDVSASSGYGPAVEACDRIVALGNAPDKASVALLASAISNGRSPVAYDEAVDMAEYDSAYALLRGDLHGD